MSRTALRPRVLIVGAGLAGTATAIRLLRFARSPLEIVLLERHSAYRSAGVAYHRDGNPWDHVFNIQAGRMSVFREDVLDFVRWANHEADRRDWPEPGPGSSSSSRARRRGGSSRTTWTTGWRRPGGRRVPASCWSRPTARPST